MPLHGSMDAPVSGCGPSGRSHVGNPVKHAGTSANRHLTSKNIVNAAWRIRYSYGHPDCSSAILISSVE